MTDAAFDAVVLAGGAARRLGGRDKPALRIAGASLLERVLDAVSGAASTVVVGPRRDLAVPAVWCQEVPPGSGPVAAIAAGLARVGADRLVLLAADLPWIAPAVGPLRAALDAPETPDAAVLVDASGRRNVLAAAWRTASLRAALVRVGPPAGRPVRALYDGAAVATVPDAGGWGADCDTWDDLQAARSRAAAD